MKPAALRRSSFSFFLIPLLILLAACGSTEPQEDREGVIRFSVARAEGRDTLRMRVEGEAVLTRARLMASGRLPHQILTGTIERGAGVDQRYPFRFVPSSVGFAEVTMELCDGAAMRTPQEVDAYILGATGDAGAATAPWCPWSSRVLAVEPLP